MALVRSAERTMPQKKVSDLSLIKTHETSILSRNTFVTVMQILTWVAPENDNNLYFDINYQPIKCGALIPM